MTVIRFSDFGLRSLREGLYFDERTPAFGIRIGKRKSTWLVLKGPNRTKHRLGSFPALGYAAARKKALETLADPLERYVGPTFPEARAEYLTQDRWRPYTKYHVSRILHRYFDWKKPLDQINHRDVILAIDAIKAPSERLHGYRNLCALFNWCVPRYL